MIARECRDWFARNRSELVPLVAASVAIIVIGAGFFYGHLNQPETGDQGIARTVKPDHAMPSDRPADFDALHREFQWRKREVAALREHIRGFEWGVQNLQRNISRIEFSIDQLKLGQALPSAPYDIRDGSREDQMRELGAMRVDFEKQAGRARQTIERFKTDIRDHNAAIEQLLRKLGDNAARP
jgi:chromosome segregation ATPase